MASPLLRAADVDVLTPDRLSALRREAAATHPAVAAARLRAAAADADTRSVRLWDDPMAGLSFMAANRMMRREEGDIRIGFEQPLPKPGLFQANRDKAAAMKRAEDENARGAAIAIGAQAARGAIELALADESIAILRTQLAWLETQTENARQRSLDPATGAAEALRMETELAKEKQMLAEAMRTRGSLADRLNLLLGRPSASSWAIHALPAAPPPVPVLAAELARISHANPKLRMLKETAAAARAGKQATQRERQPQLSIGLDTAGYSGGEPVSSTLGLKMSLPWFNDRSYSARSEAAGLREQDAAAEIENAERETIDRVIAATTEAANAAARASAYAGEVQERARLASESVQAAWLSSKATLTDLLETQRTLLAIRLDQRRFIAMQLAALEELQSLVPSL